MQHWVIVGAGSAGCVLANRLSADPDRHVTLLDDGPDLAPNAVPPAIAGPDYDNVAIEVLPSAAVLSGTPTASYDSTNNRITITVNNAANTKLANIAASVSGCCFF